MLDLLKVKKRTRMAFEVIGKLHKKFDAEEKSSSFKVRNFVIVTKDGEYEQFINFQLTQDKCEIVDKFEVGSEIKVHFNLRGREWQGKYFTNLQAWRIEGDASANVADAPDDPFPSMEDVPLAEEDQNDDLPF